MPAGEAAPPTSADTIAWNWVFEELADCKEFDTSILSALLRWYPSIIADPIYGPATRERLILTYLEELVDSTESLPSSPQPKSATGAPVPGSNVLDCGINDGPWSESTLCHLLQKVGGLKSTGECIDESCRSVLRQIILQKRHALPKTSLDLDSILEDCRQGVSSSNKFSCLGKRDKLNSLHSQNVNDSEIASKKLKLSNSHVEQVKLLSPSKTNQRLLLAEDSSRHEQQSKQNRQNAQISVDDNNTTSTKQSITPVSLVEKNKKLQSSSKMKTGDDIHIPDVLSDGGQKVLSELSNSHVEQVKLLSPSKTNQRLLLAEDSSRHEQQSKQNRQNVQISVDDNNTTSTKQNITPVSLVEKNKKLQSSSIMKTGDDIHIPDVLSDGGQKVLSELSNSHVEQVKLLSPSKTNQRLLLAEDSSRHEQQYKQNRQNVQISVDDNNTTSTKQSITPVSLVEKNKKLQSSSKMKTGDDIHIPDVLSDGGQKVLSELSNSHVEQVKLLSPSKTNQRLLLAEDSSRHEQQSKQNRQNVQISVDDNNTTSTKQNITPVSLVEKNKKLQSSSKMKTGDDIHIPDVLSDGGQKVLSESSSDVGGYDDAIPDFHPNDEILAAEKLKLLNSQHPVNNHSQIGGWTQERSCIKCDEGGQVLICTGSECPIAVHESCLGSSIDIENPEDFKCPFCSYLLAASAYYEARKKVSVARQTLSSFMGRERVGQKTVSPPPLMRESSHARKPSNGNHPDRVCANHRREIVKEPGRQNQAKAPIGNNDNLHAREEHPLMGRTDDAAATSGETETVNECHVISKSQHQEHAVAADESHVVSKSQHQEQAVPDEIHEECEKVIEQDPAIEHDVDRQKRSKICSGEHSSSSQDSKHQISTRRFRRYSNPLFPYARRNRLPWTSEEEATLKEAMQIFYQSGEKGISWVKIWEFGRHIFHKTRRPADLKDKWRNIRKREG